MMNNEEKILSIVEILANKIDILMQGQANMAVRLDSLETRFDNLESKVDRNYNHFLDLEALNGKRHIEMMDLITKNTTNIDYLKAVK